MTHPMRANIAALFVSLLVALGSPASLGGTQDFTAHNETVVTPYDDKDAYSIYAILLEGAETSVSTRIRSGGTYSNSSGSHPR